MVPHWATGDWTVTSCTVALCGSGITAKDRGESVVLKKLCSKAVFKRSNINYRWRNIGAQTLNDGKISCVFPVIKYANPC